LKSEPLEFLIKNGKLTPDELAFLGLLRSAVLKKRSIKTSHRMDVIIKAILRCMK